jgi:hypothetical protein
VSCCHRLLGKKEFVRDSNIASVYDITVSGNIFNGRTPAADLNRAPSQQFLQLSIFIAKNFWDFCFSNASSL